MSLFYREYIGVDDVHGIKVRNGDLVKVTEESLMHGEYHIEGIVIYNESDAAFYVDFPDFGEARALSHYLEDGIEVIKSPAPGE
jgi:hypothetical protein